MIIILKQHADESAISALRSDLERMGLSIHESQGKEEHILGLVGDTKAVSESWIMASPAVAQVRRISEPYKKANRKFHPNDTVVQVGNTLIGGGHFAVIAGPCSVESEEQISLVAREVQKSGASRCAAALSNPAPLPTLFRECALRGWSCCATHASRPACPLSPRS